jgi:hypothetical protein
MLFVYFDSSMRLSALYAHLG